MQAIDTKLEKLKASLTQDLHESVVQKIEEVQRKLKDKASKVDLAKLVAQRINESTSSDGRATCSRAAPSETPIN